MAPICLFCFNRLEETKISVESLLQNVECKDTDLFVFCDGPRDENDLRSVKRVYQYVSSIVGFKSLRISKSNVNLGLATSITEGVTEILRSHSRVIVLEDDLILSTNFLFYMNAALDYYDSSDKVAVVSGYSIAIEGKMNRGDVYFHRRSQSWGWGTYAQYWNNEILTQNTRNSLMSQRLLSKLGKDCGLDMVRMIQASLDSKIDSWFVWWALYLNSLDLFTVYPYSSKVSNNGFSDEGTHCKSINALPIEFDVCNNKDFLFTDFREDDIVNRKVKYYYGYLHKFTYRVTLVFSRSGRMLLIRELRRRFNS
jgi:hypothetical protein